MRKHFSRSLAFIMAIMFLFSQVVVVSTAEGVMGERVMCVCEDKNPAAGPYDYIEGNCGYYGYELYVCGTCDGWISVINPDDVPSGDHITNIPEATCTEDMECLVCNKVIAEATGHDYVSVVYPPTCEEEGRTVHTCFNCGDEYVTDIRVPTGHAWSPVETVEAGCFDDGYEKYECINDDCDAENIVTLEAPMAHINYVATYVEATCYDGAYTYHSCNVCGYELIEPDAAHPALGHDLVYHEAKAPTCTEDGWFAYQTCTRCDYTTFEVDYATDHTPAEAVEENVVDPTCTEDGSYDLVVYCANCDYEFSRRHIILPAMDHEIDVTTVAPTCIEDGYDLHYCVNCDYSYADNYVDADPTAHEGEIVGRVEPTCTAEGSTGEFRCTYCSELLAPATVIPKLDHNIVKHNGKAPTCTEGGWTPYEACTNCDYTTYTELPANGHDKGISKGIVAPKCLEQGYTIWQCAVCEETFRADYTDATGHTLEYVDAKEATCTEIGWDAYEYCTVIYPEGDDCGYTTYVEIPATGHSYEAVITEPTCTEEGYTTYTCHCGDSYVEDYVDALGHIEGEEVIENEVLPTCTEPGSYDIVVYCTTCNEELSRDNVAVDALGHTEEADPAIVPTVDSIGWTEEIYCSVCGLVLVERVPVDESVYFTYVASGINGVNKAVNSGYITVDVYLNVETEFARIYGVDLALNYTEALSYVNGVGGLFNTFSSNAYVDSFGNNAVKLTSDMGMTEGTKVLAQGEYHFATLTFKVANDYGNRDASFDVILAECELSRDTTLENEVVVDYGTGVSINVTTLGDADGDGKVTTDDANLLYEWFLARKEYDVMYIFDMDKNGTINGDDFAYLRGAIVYDNAYLLV